MNEFKEKWITDFTDDLIVNTIWDYFPSASKQLDKFKVYNWLEKNEDDFKSYLGGASWDRTLNNMKPDFREWYNEIVNAMNNCDNKATDEFNRFFQAVNSEFSRRYEEILEEYRKDAGLDD